MVAVPQRELTVVPLKELDAVPLREKETVILSRTNRNSLKGASTDGVREHSPTEGRQHRSSERSGAVPQIELYVVRLKVMDAVPLRGTETVILSRANRTNLKGASTVHVGKPISVCWR